MRTSSPSSGNTSFILVLTGTGALLVLLIVLMTGGFVIDAGPLHFSSRRPTAAAAGVDLGTFAAWAADEFQLVQPNE